MGNAATALRSQWGFGDAAAKEQLASIISRDTKLLKGSGPGAAETIYEDGTRNVYLNGYSENMTQEEQLKLGVTLQHEAYRNGIDDGAEGQFVETANAVAGHTAMALRMGNDARYSQAVGNIIGSDKNLSNDVQALIKAQESGDWSAYGRYVGNSYDTSADYWKLISRSDGTHSLEWDGQKDLTVEYQDQDQNGNWVETGSDFIKMGSARSRGQALVQIMGDERILDQVNMLDPDFYRTVKDLPQADREEKLGEFLMERQGMSFETDKNGKNGHWKGTSEFRLTDSRTDGYILFNDLGNGNYDRFTVSAILNRKGDSWEGVIGTGKPVTPENKKGLDNMEFYKKSLNGVLIDKYVLDGMQTVDVYDKERDQPYDSAFLKKVIQGNTVVSDFSMKVNPGDKWHYMLTQNAKTLDGDWINQNGSDGQPGGRWWLHAGTTYQTSDGCNIPSNEAYLDFKQEMQQWGLHQNHEIYTQMNDWRGWWIQRRGTR